LIRTSCPTRSTDGFSLVELLVVVALIGLISVISLPNVTSYFKLSLNSAAREMAGVFKESYNSSVMTGRVFRIVYDLKNQQYWAESGPNTILLDTSDTKEREERRKRFTRDSDKKEQPVGFQLDKGVTRGKVSLPRGVEFRDVTSEQSKEPVTSGLTYTHFFPHGLTEQTIIHLKDTQNHNVSLVISTIAGRTKLIERYIDAREAFGED
jgi:prepilin-type N-terminal cleavage/methylation domain-containing protein